MPPRVRSASAGAEPMTVDSGRAGIEQSMHHPRAGVSVGESPPTTQRTNSEKNVGSNENRDHELEELRKILVGTVT